MITGVGVVSSIGIGSDAFFDALLGKTSGICSLAERTDGLAKPAPDSRPEGMWVGGPILDFEAKAYVRPRKALKVMCREIQLAFAASVLAIEHAGLSDDLPASEEGRITPDRIGTVFGSEMFYGPPAEMSETIVECLRDDEQVDVARLGMAARKTVMPLWMLKYLPNMPACHVGISMNAHGPNNSLVLGDVSGPAAITESAACLSRGIADVMVTGGVGTRINPTRMHYRHDTPLPEIQGDVAYSSRPHDPAATGVIGGEAAVSLILETEPSVTSRGGKPVATILGSASRFVPSQALTHQARSAELVSQHARGSRLATQLAVQAALDRADCTAEQIGLVVSHAMGDPPMDGAERAALSELGIRCPAVAPIAALGHTGAAVGAVAVATGALCLKNGVIPPTVGVDADSAQATAGGLLPASAPLRRPHVLCLSHTSEGSCCAIVLGR